MHMDLDRLQSDLRRLAEIVGSWDASKEIDALERDLVLEKLRGLYETVRFGVRSETVPAEPALPIDLGEVLSLDEVLDEFGKEGDWFAEILDKICGGKFENFRKFGFTKFFDNCKLGIWVKCAQNSAN